MTEKFKGRSFLKLLDFTSEEIGELLKLAAELIDSGAALKTLEKVIEVSNRPEVEV